MTDLTNIFPNTYSDVPTWQEIENMLQEILNRADSVDMVVSKIEKESCPYYKEALIRCLEERWPLLCKSDKELLGYYSGNYWYPYWAEPKDQFNKLIKQYKEEQQPIEYVDPIDVDAPPVVCNIDTQENENASTIRQIVSSIKMVVKDLRDIHTTQPITINMPIYINSHIHTYNDNTQCNVLQGPMYDTQFTK